MSQTTAQTLINGAMDLIGVGAPGESFSGADAQDAWKHGPQLALGLR